MNYLTPFAGNCQKNISAKTNVSKNCTLNMNPAKARSSVGRGRGVHSLFLMIGCLILVIMPKNSMASSGHDIFSSFLFCENECSEFVSIPASIGIGAGGLAGVPIGMGLGVPVAIGMGTAMAVSAHKPGEIIRGSNSAIGWSTIIVAAVGAKVIGNITAFPFWVTEKVVYDAPLKIASLVRSIF